MIFSKLLLLVLFCTSLTIAKSDFIGEDCDKNAKNPGYEVIGCEKVKTWDINACPVYVESDCDEKFLCKFHCIIGHLHPFVQYPSNMKIQPVPIFFLSTLLLFDCPIDMR